ncbi:MAG: lasso RiPP family leader peptide-containing protein [Solirubrobacteraceae bacterium]
MNDAPMAGGGTTKKQYEAPALVAYGSIGKLTQTGAGSGTDGGVAGMSMACL